MANFKNCGVIPQGELTLALPYFAIPTLTVVNAGPIAYTNNITMSEAFFKNKDTGLLQWHLVLPGKTPGPVDIAYRKPTLLERLKVHFRRGKKVTFKRGKLVLTH